MEFNPREPLVFGRPPVVETILGVQFAPIADFTASHYGWFWKKSLDSSWTKSQDAPRLPDQFEQFGDRQAWAAPALTVIPKLDPDRALFIHADDDRVVQLQNTKLLYNWRKRENAYPSFSVVLPEFERLLAEFASFLREADLEPTPHNQWELAYVNQVLKGTLWESSDDFAGIFPGLFGRTERRDGDAVLETASCATRHALAGGRGRVTAHAQQVRTADDQDALQVTLAARGPVLPGEPDRDLASGLAIGHEALTRTFLALASDSALAHWRST